MTVIEGRDGLEVEDQHRTAHTLNRGENLTAGGIGPDITEDDVNILTAESFTRFGGAGSGVPQSSGDHLGSHGFQTVLNPFLISLKPFLEARKLFPVGGQANPEQTDTSFFLGPWFNHEKVLQEFGMEKDYGDGKWKSEGGGNDCCESRDTMKR
jgi:hypothetical protein